LYQGEKWSKVLFLRLVKRSQENRLTRSCDLTNGDTVFKLLVRMPVICHFHTPTANLDYSSRTTFLSQSNFFWTYRGADKSLARPTSRCILFDGWNISFDASLVIYINSTNIPPIVIINKILLLLLLLVFSPWAGMSRDQSSVRRLVWLWYAASWASS